MTPEQTDILRSWLYLFGLLPAAIFGLRSILQWWKSEQVERSIVPKSFWVLSCIGNALVVIHSFIQLHFPLYLLQSQQFVLSWRNLNLMGPSPWSLKKVIWLLVGSAIGVTILFALQQPLLHPSSFGWVRAPKVSPTSPEFGFWVHFFGCLGITIFSSRFWIQWWDAEQNKKSVLSVQFWWISIIGTLITVVYFFLLSDWINIIGPLCSIIPYSRNIILLRREQQEHCDIAILAGEISGDLLGGAAAQELLALTPSLRLSGIAGPSMRQKGVKPWLRSEQLSVMGIIDVIKKAPFLFLTIHRTVRRILREQPSAVLFIDQPSFSITIAKRLKAKGYTGKLIQVVAPTVWAYRSERADIVADLFDLILPLYRFERDFFIHKLPTTWIGHPSSELMKLYPPSKEQKNTLAVFPGSRPGEIERNLPIQLRAAQLLIKDHPELTVAISACDESLSIIQKMIRTHFNGPYDIVHFSDRYPLMNRSRAAIAKSGTVTLELALFNVPTACCYQTNLLTRWWARTFLQLRPRFFALPNILTGQEIFPECILPPVSPESLATALQPYLSGERALPHDMSERLSFQIDPGEPSGVLIARTVLQTIGAR